MKFFVIVGLAAAAVVAVVSAKRNRRVVAQVKSQTRRAGSKLREQVKR